MKVLLWAIPVLSVFAHSPLGMAASLIIPAFDDYCINDVEGDGIPEEVSDVAAFIGKGQGSTRGFLLYDLLPLDAPPSKITAVTLAGALVPNNSPPNALRRDILLVAFADDGVPSVDDFNQPGIDVGFAFVPIHSGTGVYSLDALAAIKSLLEQGTRFVGIRFVPHNDQTFSVATLFAGPFPPATMTIQFVPEPSTQVLTAAVLFVLGLIRRRQLA